VHERDDGSVVIRYRGEVLDATAVREAGHVSQQDIESRKYRARVLTEIRDAQLARDEEALRSSKMTNRQKERLRADLVRRGVRPAVGPRTAPPH
jgi:hypothetical protein